MVNLQPVKIAKDWASDARSADEASLLERLVSSSGTKDQNACGHEILVRNADCRRSAAPILDHSVRDAANGADSAHILH